jgi:hypothetical protein
MSINNNEQFGDFITAPQVPESAPPPPTLDDLMKNNCNFEVTNKIIYKKLIELQNEVVQLKISINNLNNINNINNLNCYPRPSYYPTQSYHPQMYPNMSTINNPKF